MGPLVPIVYQSLLDGALYEPNKSFTLDNYVQVFSNPMFLRALQNTLFVSLGATLVSTFVGGVAAILFGRTNLPFKRMLSGILLWPMFISHLVIAFGWVIVYGPAGYITQQLQSITGTQPWDLYTIGGIILAAGVVGAPLTFLFCAGSTALSEASLEDAARTCGAGPIRTLWTIALPMLQPAILYSAILNFTNALEMLAIPFVLGESTNIELFSTLIYTQGFAAIKPNYGIVSTAAIFLIVVVFLLLTLQRRLLSNTRRFVTVGGKASRPRLLDLGPLRWPAFAVVAAYAVVFIVIPIGALFIRSSVSILSPLVPFWNYFTPRHLIAAFTEAQHVRTIVNTILVATGAGLIGTFFVAVLAVIIHRSEFRFRWELEYVAMLPRAIPGVVAGMGFFYAIILLPPLGWIRATIWVLMVAYIMRFIPLALGALSPSLHQLGRELDSSARVIGASWWQTLRTIVLPLMRPAMLSSFVLVFVVSIKEYSTAIYLYTPGNEVLGSSLLTYFYHGDFAMVSALSVVQIVITLVAVYAARALFGVKAFGN
ncbi:membrane protein [Devosia yakushimensis]|uniref:Membrane protein n=2 Tax=Devosia yakushimensis TaxID=470028 RepID=A0ABQ5UJF8_9HYPH|nr:membrane protein [Devosia yakushimensis]